MRINRPLLFEQLYQLLPARYWTILFVLLAGVVGYLMAPADLLPGDYTAHIQVTLPDQTITAVHPFKVGRVAKETIIQTVSGDEYQLIVSGASAFPNQLGQSLTYRVRLLGTTKNAIPLTLDNVSSTIIGPSYQQHLPATKINNGWLVFTMHIPFKAKIALALLFIVATLWLTELIPLAASALLIPVVVVAAGITDAQTILQPFSHPIIILFLAGFLLAEGMRHTGVDRRLALAILSRASLKPAYLMLTMMGLTAFLSMWMSNTASVAVIIPIALAILDKIPEEVGRTGFRRALILSVAYAATVGGVGSAIGTPANIMAISFLNEFAGTDLAFVDWFRFGLPVTILMIPIIWLYLLLSFHVKLGEVGGFSREMYEQEKQALGTPNRGQWLVLLAFAGVIVLWLTERWHGLSTTIVALSGAVFLFLTNILDKESLNRINWNALLTFGGGLAIGVTLVNTGVSDWITLHLTGLEHLPPAIVIFLVAALTLVTGAFISNTATAAMLIPIAIPLAQILQIDPRLLVAVVAIGSSIDFALVVGTPPTMMAYSTGLFRPQDIFRRGILLNVIGLLILSFGVIWIWQLLGIVTLR
ncbi:MAG: SLC13/DASS family transporter [Ardenticatenaceae bacterium]|nr:SLC13/DASS family transporter [Ardenticatenaceae bacterium]